jgi:hypothetical protein
MGRIIVILKAKIKVYITTENNAKSRQRFLTQVEIHPNI